MRLIVLSATLIIGVMILAACALELDPTLFEEALAPTATPLILETSDDVPRISVDEAKVHFDDGTALFVDSRRLTAYRREHIPGAVRAYSSSGADAFSAALNSNQLIITYCT